MAPEGLKETCRYAVVGSTKVYDHCRPHENHWERKGRYNSYKWWWTSRSSSLEKVLRLNYHIFFWFRTGISALLVFNRWQPFCILAVYEMREVLWLKSCICFYGKIEAFSGISYMKGTFLGKFRVKNVPFRGEQFDFGKTGKKCNNCQHLFSLGNFSFNL